MNRRLSRFCLTTVATLLGAPTTSALAQQPAVTEATIARTFVIPATESVHPQAVQLESPLPLPRRGAARAGAETGSSKYSLVLHGMGRPGLVAIEFLDGSGNLVAKRTGRLTGNGGEGRPREGTGQHQRKPANFKELGFSEGGVVKVDLEKGATGTKLTITGEKQWAIVTLLGQSGTRKSGSKG